jgi:transcription termination/antitermination protein NusG
MPPQIGRPSEEQQVSNGHPVSDDASAVIQWLVLRTRSRHEKKVRDELISRRIETFLPLYERWSHWKDRRMRVEFPLFPGYCFVHLRSTERLLVLNTPGTAGFLGFNGYAEPVPDAEIAALSRLVASAIRYDPHPFLTEGMLVEVIRGPLAGVRGTIVRKDRSTKLVLAITLIHQAAALEIHPADVAPV